MRRTLAAAGLAALCLTGLAACGDDGLDGTWSNEQMTVTVDGDNWNSTITLDPGSSATLTGHVDTDGRKLVIDNFGGGSTDSEMSQGFASLGQKFARGKGALDDSERALSYTLDGDTLTVEGDALTPQK